MERVNSDSLLATPFDVGSVRFRNRVLLAPMSGVSDVPFRKLAWKYGAGMVFSEMVASEALVTGQAEMQMKAQSAGLPVHAVQIAGRQAEWMALAAQLCEKNGADLIDINMGCPARRVTSGLSGSALMRDLDHAMSLIEAVIAAVKIPVTLKMRLGWDEQSINAPELAVMAQAAGIRMITVHGRTRCQFYKGKANWQAIRAVRDVTDVPLVVNGDIGDIQSSQTALKQSGADAVMVGRASYGAPWLPGILASDNPSDSRYEPHNSKWLTGNILEHFEDVLHCYGEEMGIRQFRKHLGWYLDHLAAAGNRVTDRRLMMTSFDQVQIRRLIEENFARVSSARAA